MKRNSEHWKKHKGGKCYKIATEIFLLGAINFRKFFFISFSPLAISFFYSISRQAAEAREKKFRRMNQSG